MYGAAMSFAYHAYEAVHMMVSPMRGLSDAHAAGLQEPGESADLHALTGAPSRPPASCSSESRAATASRASASTRRRINGVKVPVEERVVWERPFCKLVYFDRQIQGRRKPRPKVLLVAPMSGHYATLLRGTVEAFLPGHEVYITDWVDARMVPLAAGPLRSRRLHRLRHRHAAYARAGHPCHGRLPAGRAGDRGRRAHGERRATSCAPRSMTLMGGPIDTRRSPTARQPARHGARHRVVPPQLSSPWCRSRISGAFREVYPGFLQLSGFMAMNFDRHVSAHYEMFKHLVERRRRLGREAP